MLPARNLGLQENKSKSDEQLTPFSSTSAGLCIKEPQTLASEGREPGDNGAKAIEIKMTAGIPVLDVTEEPKPTIGQHIDATTDGIGGVNKKRVDADECPAVEVSTAPSFDSPETVDGAHGEDRVTTVIDEPLPSFDSANPTDVNTVVSLESAKGSIAGEGNDQIGVGVGEVEPGEGDVTRDGDGHRHAVLGGMETEQYKKEKEQELEEQQGQGQRQELAQAQAQEQEMFLRDRASSVRYQAAQIGPPESEKESMVPNSRLLCNQTARMKDREDRFCPGKTCDSRPPKGGEVDVTTRKATNPDRSADTPNARRHAFESHFEISIDSRGQKKIRGKELRCEGGTSPEPPLTSTVEGIHEAKLTKRKEKRLAFTSSEFDDNPSAKIGASAGERKEVTVTESGEATSKVTPDSVATRKASVKRQAESDERAKMARRAKRFGLTACRPGISSVSDVSSHLRLACIE